VRAGSRFDIVEQIENQIEAADLEYFFHEGRERSDGNAALRLGLFAAALDTPVDATDEVDPPMSSTERGCFPGKVPGEVPGRAETRRRWRGQCGPRESRPLHCL
jgi:hypothetical protein